MSSESPDKATSEGTEVGFWNALWSARKVIALLAVASGVAAAAFAYAAPEEWEASGLVRLAKIGEVRPGVSERVWVEPPPLSVERLGLASFQISVLQSLGHTEDAITDEADLYRRSLRGRLIANAEVIQVKVRGRTPQSAKQLLDATVRKLSDTHEELAAPTLKRSREELTATQQRLGDLDREKRQLYGLLAAAGNDKSQLATTIYALDAERRELTKQQSLLEDQLRSDRLVPTALIGPGLVPRHRVFPRKGLIVLTGIFVGLAIGVGWAISRHGNPSHFRSRLV